MEFAEWTVSEKTVSSGQEVYTFKPEDGSLREAALQEEERPLARVPAKSDFQQPRPGPGTYDHVKIARHGPTAPSWAFGCVPERGHLPFGTPGSNTWTPKTSGERQSGPAPDRYKLNHMGRYGSSKRPTYSLFPHVEDPGLEDKYRKGPGHYDQPCAFASKHPAYTMGAMYDIGKGGPRTRKPRAAVYGNPGPGEPYVGDTGVKAPRFTGRPAPKIQTRPTRRLGPSLSWAPLTSENQLDPAITDTRTMQHCAGKPPLLHPRGTQGIRFGGRTSVRNKMLTECGPGAHNPKLPKGKSFSFLGARNFDGPW